MEIVLFADALEPLYEALDDERVESISIKYSRMPVHVLGYHNEYPVSLLEWLLRSCWDEGVFERIMATACFPQKYLLEDAVNPPEGINKPLFSYCLVKGRVRCKAKLKFLKELASPHYLILPPYATDENYYGDVEIDHQMYKAYFIDNGDEVTDQYLFSSGAFWAWIDQYETPEQFAHTIELFCRHFVTGEEMERWGPDAYIIAIGLDYAPAIDLLLEHKVPLCSSELELAHVCGKFRQMANIFPRIFEIVEEEHLDEYVGYLLDMYEEYLLCEGQPEELAIEYSEIELFERTIAPYLLNVVGDFSPLASWWARTSYLLGGATFQQVSESFSQRSDSPH